MMLPDCILPDWPAPPCVHALQTTRAGGVSRAPCDSFNLALHVGDEAFSVAANRSRLREWLPDEPFWLEQCHGIRVVQAGQGTLVPAADACVTRERRKVCAVMTADCLPVLLCDQAGSEVGVAHAGWRGLAGGVIEATVTAMKTPGSGLMAWLGPAIGQQAFEVGNEVRKCFVAHDPQAGQAFIPHGEKYLADIYQLARQRLHALGITQVYGGGLCTFSDRERFFSYRRDGRCGRMATLVWIA